MYGYEWWVYWGEIVMLKTYDVCLYIRDRQLNKVAELLNYDWSSEFKMKELDTLRTTIKGSEGYSDVDCNTLTLTEMTSLGFHKWNDSLILIPLYLFKFLKPGVTYPDIKGDKVMINSKTNNDHRSGLLAFGVRLPCPVH